MAGLMLLLAAVAVIAILGIAANHLGVDSRDGSGDEPARPWRPTVDGTTREAT